MKIIHTLLFLLAVLPAAPERAFALAGDWQRDEAVSVRLISEVEGTGLLGVVPLGLEIKLAPNWHTYWRSPGQAGLPPQVDWRTSQTENGNLETATLLYPAPKRYSAFGLETVGYTDHVVLPIDAEPREIGKPLRLGMALDLLLCSDMCVPKHFVLTLNVPAGEAKTGAEAALLNRFRDALPDDGEKSGLDVKDVSTNGESLTIEIASRDALQAPDIFVENGKNIEFSKPQVTLASDKMSATLNVKPVAPLPEDVALAGLPLTLTVTDGNRALETKTAAPEALFLSSPGHALSFGLIILFAIIGGFILNLMPCVLPVLSLKILSVVSHGGGEKSLVRQSFLVTAGGILFSYLALAVVTVLLREFGVAVGWGVQFQQPIFLGLLVLLLTFFAANLWGLFEIHLPRFLADNLPGPYHPKLAGDFATGAFATLLATPCTAPFLGTAIGFALAAGPREIFIVFAALGFGMALPYLAIALFPRFATCLPRPGRWMILLRHALGWALAATAIWILWILAAQIAKPGALVIALCMTGILGLIMLRRLSAGYHRYSAFGILAFALLALGTMVNGAATPKPAVTVDGAWLPFDETLIAREVAEGKTVFVDVTADWCLTCKANKKFVLDRGEVADRLFHSDIVPMQANWTNPNSSIATFLQKYGRYGIPFNAAFGPGAPQGLVLPELLSPQAVRDALDKAAKTTQP